MSTVSTKMAREGSYDRDMARRLAEAEATIAKLRFGQKGLRESEERYRRIVETADEGIMTLDTESRVTFANQRLADMLRYSMDDLLGLSFLDFLPEAGWVQARKRVADALLGRLEESEVPVLRQDGSEMWGLIKTSPIRDVDGAFIGILAMMTDKTGHREGENALRKSEEQYRQIVEATSDGIIKIDHAARIVFANHRFAEMLGYEPLELIGLHLQAFMIAPGRTTAMSSIQSRRRGQKDAVDTRLRHRDGTYRAVNIAGSPLFDGADEYVGALAVVRDVTERNKMQSQLMVSDRMASVGTLAAGVAHEINNPLAAVISSIGCMSESVTRLVERSAASATEAVGPDALFVEEILSPLDDARDAAERVRFIVRDLKIFSRSPSDEATSLVDVNDIMESSLRMAWNEIRHRARLVKDYGTVPGVVANDARLGQVFLNLVVNAAQALPEGRSEDNEIRVSTRVVGGRIVIEVADTGAGIEPEVLGRIFDAFFTTKEVGVGTGLGLAICQRIVTDMGGELTVESELGRGSVFRVSLPVKGKPETRTLAPPEQVVVAGRRGRILVVDDEELLLRSLRRVLAREHEVVATADAREALALCLRGEKFDLILCDLMMPDMTGMDLHEELSRVAPELARRMVFLTGGAFTARAQQFLADPTRTHIEKPFDGTMLRAMVHTRLREDG